MSTQIIESVGSRFGRLENRLTNTINGMGTFTQKKKLTRDVIEDLKAIIPHPTIFSPIVKVCE